MSGSGPAEWLASTPSGSDVFFTEGGDLYRFDVEDQKQVQLTQDAGVQGMLGISSDGSYAYFVAKGVLAGENVEGHAPSAGKDNLYEWHEGVPVAYIANLKEGKDESDWRGHAAEGVAEAANGEKSSRVTVDGGTALFSSTERLTEYDNNGWTELYLYDAADAKLTCVSCNPDGRMATTGSYLTREVLAYEAYPTPRTPFLTRNLSDNGSQVFFQTEEALVAKDSNGQSDVYEWEDGRHYLISSGQGNAAAYFADASANGDDVFFFTRQSLVGEDQDENTDLYDARVGGGIAAQNPVVIPPCVGEECHGTIASAPVFGVPASVVYSGASNLAPEPVVSTGPRSGTGSQLAAALRACAKKRSSKKRSACRARAEKRYGHKSAAKKKKISKRR